MSWQDELDVAWDRIAELEPHELLDAITGIVERPEVPRDVRAFHLACAHDSTGRPDLAVTGYCGSPMIGEASAIRGSDARGTEALRPGVP
ncbi:hypothetical protein [Pseudonocardia sp. HH130630-07]|uniref:hypothetical protein n=1 Tax=Pseudonocardia sp. HH130630-07 TaxID=1690815 RepID=UPI000AEEF8B0|nr:hypothetical protein [Pseudonocardia sp. HH130630-07]